MSPQDIYLLLYLLLVSLFQPWPLEHPHHACTSRNTWPLSAQDASLFNLSSKDILRRHRSEPEDRETHQSAIPRFHRKSSDPKCQRISGMGYQYRWRRQARKYWRTSGLACPAHSSRSKRAVETGRYGYLCCCTPCGQGHWGGDWSRDPVNRCCGWTYSSSWYLAGMKAEWIEDGTNADFSRSCQSWRLNRRADWLVQMLQASSQQSASAG